ncbi:tRNA (cytidine(34)-2'-O)-methyltransferase [Kriegella aquimaris]|uniref:Putative tRNA (cytidine(34)-2'-O)-methyltransferase n=1 Tax=Kriegella aquimaris TaxID=192904 RepID=A0A1G9PKM8_9FLAO|nr:tRNA (cytidine(34)-2'-O)-methyltransferase [Kriegella aquimaris]SDL99350.1 tRNA (cytidine/uridine-2'-O-)-methyltransferase [Kriegella aquimaris]
MPFNIVLIEPEIPNNTGNIGRLALATGSTLHLVKPFGFELDDKRLKRAGLDYWPHLSLCIYENVNDFLSQHSEKNMVFFSSRAEKSHWSIDYEDGQFLVFGKESVGLPPTLTELNKSKLYQIPLYSEHVRSLNLANAVGIAVYEGLKHLV